VLSSSSSTTSSRSGCAIAARISGLLGHHLVEGQEDIAAVETAGLGEDLVVGGEQLGELRRR
jgi:hypothetical protein